MRYVAHDYQAYATERIIDTPHIGLFLEMGLGKTVSTLTAVDLLLYDYFLSSKVLVIAPLRVAQDTWAREVNKWDHLKHLRIASILGSVKERRAAIKQQADIWIVNRENVEWLVQELGSKWDYDTVVIDESSSFKNHNSKRFKALRRVRPFIKRLIALTGTPAPNGLMDLWAPIYLLDQGERLGRTMTAFRDRYFNSRTKNQHTTFYQKEEAEERIYEALGDITVSMKAEDWLTLPPKIERTVPVELEPEAREKYKRMKRDMLLPFVDADVVATTAAVLSNKLLQMASGSVYAEDRVVKNIHDQKLDVLEELIEAAQGKPVMVFYNFIHSYERLVARFKHARTLRKGAQSNEDIAAWNNDEIPLLLLHPKSAGHGLNLQDSSCQHVIWFDMTWSLEEYLQANARVHRQGQSRSVFIHRIAATGTMDMSVIKALEEKEETQNGLMAAVKAEIEEVRRGG